MERPTKNQMQYLMTWLGMEGNKGRSFASVGLKHNVKKTTVQGAVTALVARGILDREYRLTEEGNAYMAWYRPRFQSLFMWLRLHDIEPETAEDTAYSWMADSPEEVIEMMVNETMICSVCRRIVPSIEGEAEFQGIDLSVFLPEGSYDVGIEFEREGDGKENGRGQGARSMADRAFEKPARLTVEKDGSEIILMRRRILNHSYDAPHNEVSGKMKTMDYFVKDQRKRARVDGEQVRIPTRDILWRCSRENRSLVGSLTASFTCTAGRQHMPEREAVLRIHIAQAEKLRTYGEYENTGR